MIDHPVLTQYREKVEKQRMEFIQVMEEESEKIANERLLLQQLRDGDIILDDFKRLLNQHNTLGD